MKNEKTNKSKQRSIRIDEQIIKTVEKMAEVENRTFNNMVETILLNEARNRQYL